MVGKGGLPARKAVGRIDRVRTCLHARRIDEFLANVIHSERQRANEPDIRSDRVECEAGQLGLCASYDITCQQRRTIPLITDVDMRR